MISNPYAGMPEEAGWAMGFAFGYSSPPWSVQRPAVIAPELCDAFDQGSLEGQQAAVDGLQFESVCVDTMEEHSAGSLAVHIGVPVVHLGYDLIKHAIKGVAGAVVALIELAITLPVHVGRPEEVLPQLGGQLCNDLSQMGITSLEVFCGAGYDSNVEGCQVMLTPLFRSLDQARDAVMALGRQDWIVVAWQTVACNAMVVVESS